MTYISGEQETLSFLMRESEYSGSFGEFKKEFETLNPHCGAADTLPSYTPVLLPRTFDSQDADDLRMCVKEMASYGETERQVLHSMQSEKQDVVAQIAMDHLMEEFHDYAKDFANAWDSPLIKTPFDAVNQSVPGASLLDMFGNTAEWGANLSNIALKKYAPLRRQLDQLYEAMMRRDVLSRELHILETSRMPPMMRIRQIQSQLSKVQQEIRILLPKKMSTIVQKYLRKKGFASKEIEALRGSLARKAVRGGKLLMSNFDLLKRTGLPRLRRVVRFLTATGKSLGWAGKAAGFAGKYLISPAVIGIDTYEAAKRGGRDAAVGTFLSKSAGFAVGTIALGSTAAVGAVAVNTAAMALGGNALLGSAILMCSPVLGWIALAAVGLVAAGYAAYKTEEFVSYLWEHRGEIGDKIKHAYHAVEKEIIHLWRSSSAWFHKVFDRKPHDIKPVTVPPAA